ncbi:MAG: PAS domain S-box protein [Leptospiraceae bacterium]|nr:PAS domain S-box protein [Leptospiraceae bacterium]
MNLSRLESIKNMLNGLNFNKWEKQSPGKESEPEQTDKSFLLVQFALITILLSCIGFALLYLLSPNLNKLIIEIILASIVFWGLVLFLSLKHYINYAIFLTLFMLWSGLFLISNSQQIFAPGFYPGYFMTFYLTYLLRGKKDFIFISTSTFSIALITLYLKKSHNLKLEFSISQEMYWFFSSSFLILMASVFYSSRRKNYDDGFRKKENFRDTLSTINSEEIFLNLFENSPVAIILTRLRDDMILDVNLEWRLLWGYEKSESIGKTKVQLGLWVNPDDRNLMLQALRESDHVSNFETQMKSPIKGIRVVLLNIRKIFFENEDCLIIQTVDITEKSKLEESLRQSNEKFEQIANHIPEVFWMYDNQKNQLAYVSKAFEEIWGIKREDVYRDRSCYIQAIHPDDKNIMFSALEKQGRGEPIEMEYRIVNSDGSILWIHDHSYPVFDRDGTLLKTVGLATNITSSVKIREELLLNQEQLKAIIVSLDDIVFETSEDGFFLNVWTSNENALVIPRDEFIGKHLSELPDKNLSHFIEKSIKKVLESGHSETFESQMQTPNGMKWFSSVFTPIHNIHLNKKSISVMVRDITEKKQADQELKNARELFQSTFMYSPVAYALVSIKDNSVININQSFEKLFGYSSSEIIGKSAIEVITFVTRFPENLYPVFEKIKETGSLSEFEFELKNARGEFHWASAYANTILLDEPFMLLEYVDINQRKKAEISLRRNESLLKEMGKLAKVGGWELDIKSNKQLWTEETYAIYDRDPLDSTPDLGKEISLISQTHREDFESLLKNAISKGKPFDEEIEIITNLGNSKWIRIVSIPVLEKNEIIKLTGAIQDISERKKMEEELKRSNSELEQFAYIASHDLQEPLRTVVGMVELLRKRYQDKMDDRSNEYIKYAVEASLRMQNLIKDLLDYSRVDRRNKPLQKIQAQECFNIAILNLDEAIKESGSMISSDPLPEIFADSTQITQVFQNIIGNSIKFRKAGIQPQIHVSAKESEENWIFSIQDNGLGIEEEFFDRIFLIFQRLNPREDFKGTGIGLSFCKKVVERHGGTIWVSSKINEGSTFYFTIPKKEGK